MGARAWFWRHGGGLDDARRPLRQAGRGRPWPSLAVAGLLAAATLAGCGGDRARQEAALKAEFAPVASRQGFVDRVAGRAWRSEEVLVRFSGDGTLAGDVSGVPVSGVWEWRDGQLCAEYLVATSGGTSCAEVGLRSAGERPGLNLPENAAPRLRPEALLLVPRGGTGAPMVWEAA